MRECQHEYWYDGADCGRPPMCAKCGDEATSDRHPALEPWQARVVAERDELSGRIRRLEAFIGSQPDVPERSISLLKTQLAAMKMYDLVLDMRIADFRLKPSAP